MKILFLMSSQKFLPQILKYLNLRLDISFVFEDIAPNAEEGTFSLADKDFKMLSVNSLKDPSTSRDYDYVFVFGLKESKVASELTSFGFDKTKIIDFSFLIENIFVKKTFLLKSFEKQIDKFKVLVLGNGSTFTSLDLNSFNIPAVSFAEQDQDLYFDYLYLKKILSMPQNKIKYVLFGLSPYSFRFNLFKSKYKDLTLSYCPIFQDTYTFSVNEIEDIFTDKFLKFYDDEDLINLVEKNIGLDFNDPFNYRKSNNRALQQNDFFGVRSMVKKYCSNNDDNILQENVKIFAECIQLCKENDIVPVVFVSPVILEYRYYFSEKVLCEFKTILLELQEKYQFKILDYWDLNEFNVGDFFHLDELNLSGARKFTPYISNYINKLESKKIRIAFTMITMPSWDKIIPLYKKMCENKQIEIYGLLLPGDPKASPTVAPDLLYREEWNFFHNLYDNDENIILIDAVQNGRPLDLRQFHFDYVFYIQPYDYLYHYYHKCRTVSKFAKTFHILYGIMNSENSVPFYLQFSDFYNAINFYFVSCEQLVNIFSTVYQSDDDKQHFIFRGLPEIEQACKENEKNFYINLEKSRKSVLWTPRWNYFSNVGGSHFLEYKDNFNDLRKKYPDLGMYVRPHPALFGYMTSTGRMTEKEVKYYKNFLKKHNIVLDETPRYNDIIETADIMLADATSIMINFFLTGKPIIYCPATAPLFGDNKDMESGLYIANNWTEVEKYLEMLLSGEDPLKDERRRIFELLLERHKNASERIVNTLVEDYETTKLKVGF